jgi:hypothetical protein
MAAWVVHGMQQRVAEFPEQVHVLNFYEINMRNLESLWKWVRGDRLRCAQAQVASWADIAADTAGSRRNSNAACGKLIRSPSRQPPIWTMKVRKRSPDRIPLPYAHADSPSSIETYRALRKTAFPIWWT